MLSIQTGTLTLTPALKLTELRVPTKVTAGATLTLDCIFDLEGDDLYSVKWYKDNKEFYRFLPSDVPRRQLYPVEGISVSLNGDSNSSVTLNNVSRSASGRYICEISCDAPSFKTVSFSEYLHVVEKPPEVRVPPFGLLGDMVYLDCSYDSENAEAQTVTWLKDGEEFYQFSPRREPSVMTFDVKGVNVNIELSNGSTVCLEKLSSSTAGTYSCEVSSEQLLFRSTAGGNLAIVERLPATPRISASIAGDEVQVTCVGVHSKPHPTLYLFIDDRLSNSTTTVRGDIDGLFTASLRATTTVGKPGAEGVQVRVRCEALFSDAYSATVEKTIRIEPRWRLLSRASFPKGRCAEKALAVFSKVWMAFAEVQEASTIHDDSFELFQ
ncbi:hypothetical protein HPB50_020572 [Hyalomma asiaticum]|uniref:Uncharacterized protein n=1 Tax=Hyalomma asiaticum TaxID=266040 RepID=A0ACB7SPX1_HYAAI|nr:hypothetical protein HPB50_020572 [Hyalomma asiaticum]